MFMFKGGDLFSLPFVPEQEIFKEVTINSAGLKVEVANTKAKRSKGLSGRAALPENEGLLFLFPEPGRNPFWMKELKFPLDFIWIKGDNVVDLLENVPVPAAGVKDADLPIYTPKEDADKVLELNAGAIQKYNIKVGDTFTIEQ